MVQDLDSPRSASAGFLFTFIAPEGGAIVITFRTAQLPGCPATRAEDKRDLQGLFDTAPPGSRDVLVSRQSLPRIKKH